MASCKAVMKLDCIHHVGKCFCGKLEDLYKKGAKAQDNNSVYSGTNRQGTDARAKLQKYFNKAVRSNTRPGVITPHEQDEAVTSMSRERHQFCPDNSCCDYKCGVQLNVSHTISIPVSKTSYYQYTTITRHNKSFA